MINEVYNEELEMEKIKNILRKYSKSEAKKRISDLMRELYEDKDERNKRIEELNREPINE